MWQKIKERAIELVKWAERELSGKTGAEKRAAVVTKMCALIGIPYLPEWIEVMFEPILYGWVVDKVCNFLNILTEHDITAIALNPEQITQAAELLSITPAGVSILPDENSMTGGALLKLNAAGDDVDAKLAALCEMYAGK